MGIYQRRPVVAFTKYRHLMDLVQKHLADVNVYEEAGSGIQRYTYEVPRKEFNEKISQVLKSIDIRDLKELKAQSGAYLIRPFKKEFFYYLTIGERQVYLLIKIKYLAGENVEVTVIDAIEWKVEAPVPPVAPPEVTPEIVKVCEEGDTKCNGYNLNRCINNKWRLLEENSAACGGAKRCSEGIVKCFGADLYKCVNSEWVLVKRNDSYCVRGISSLCGGC